MKRPNGKTSETEPSPKPTVKRGRGRTPGKAVASLNAIPSLNTETGLVFICGQGDCSQLGLGEDIIERKKPFQIKNLTNVVELVAGGLHSLAINDKGQLYSWGCNDEGALGREGDEWEPALVTLGEDIKVVQVTAGDSITACVTSEGNLYAWGTFRNPSGVLGFVGNKKHIQKTPLKIEVGTPSTKVVKVVAGNNHLVVLTTKGKVYTVGDNKASQCGFKEYDSKNISSEEKSLKLNPLPVKNIVNIFAGGYHSFAREKTGRIYSWGMNNYNQCAIVTKGNLAGERIEKPTLSHGLTGNDITELSGGEHHTLALGGGKVYGVGRTDSSQLGLPKDHPSVVKSKDGSKAAVEVLTEISVGTTAASVICGSNQSFAVTTDQKASAWGFGESFALGHGSEEDQETPKVIEALSTKKVLKVASGGQHTLFLVKE
ncbi:RCC1/BLIP-II [Neoconidiobolus thromboides FSU 785]|nr:RCC1/BLIP-II [Neoconidiobolus thromboides FSU 785]